MILRRHDHRDGFPITIALPFMAAVLSVIPGVTHDSPEVRRAAFATAMVLFAVGVIALLVRICRDQRDRAELRIQLDSFVTLVTHSRRHRARAVDDELADEVPEPVVLDERRRRCRLLRGTDTTRRSVASGSMVVGAILGMMVVGALTGSPGGPRTPAVASPPPTADGLPDEPPPATTENEPSPPGTSTQPRRTPVQRRAAAVTTTTSPSTAPTVITTPSSTTVAMLPGPLSVVLAANAAMNTGAGNG